jgi:Trk K+ transport system NAD-binding subunit
LAGARSGWGLGRRLASRHELVVVDQNPAVADRFSTLDVQFLRGKGTSHKAPKLAGVDRCEVLVSATGMDEVNVLASLIATRLGSPQALRVVSRDDLLTPLGEGDLLREHLPSIA